MESFDQWMNLRQIEWRRANVASTELGRWSSRQYPWILPEGSWEEGLWPGIGSGPDNSLLVYLENTGVHKHDGVNISRVLGFFAPTRTFRSGGSADDKALFASFLKRHVAPEIYSLEGIELEYAEDGELHPTHLLGEEGGTRGRPRRTSANW